MTSKKDIRFYKKILMEIYARIINEEKLFLKNNKIKKLINILSKKKILNKK